MKQDEAFNPIAVRLIGANAVVLDPDFRAHLIEQAQRVGRRLYGGERAG